MNWLKSSQSMIVTSLILVAMSFLIPNSGVYLGVEETIGPYHAVYSFVPWLSQWGAIAVLLGLFSRRFPRQHEWLSPRIVLPWFGAGVVWWTAMLSLLWNMSLLEFLNERLLSYASETFGGPMSLMDWLLYLGWIVNPYQSGTPFSLVGWGGVTAFVHSVTVTAGFSGLSYVFVAGRFRKRGAIAPRRTET